MVNVTIYIAAPWILWEYIIVEYDRYSGQIIRTLTATLTATWWLVVTSPIFELYFRSANSYHLPWFYPLVGVFFCHILGITIPTDFHIFQRGWNHQPVSIGGLTAGVIFWNWHHPKSCRSTKTWLHSLCWTMSMLIKLPSNSHQDGLETT